MKKFIILTVLPALFIGSTVRAQLTGVNPNAGTVADLPRNTVKMNSLLKEDKDDTIMVSGMGNLSFIVSNTADGSNSSYKHAQRIVLPLMTSSGNQKYQLIFYGENENIPYSVVPDGNVMNMYYPILMFTEIKQKLEQAVAQKKRVQLRIIQKKDGYREAALIF